LVFRWCTEEGEVVGKVVAAAGAQAEEQPQGRVLQAGLASCPRGPGRYLVPNRPEVDMSIMKEDPKDRTHLGAMRLDDFVVASWVA